jgi:hypothetical protein
MLLAHRLQQAQPPVLSLVEELILLMGVPMLLAHRLQQAQPPVLSLVEKLILVMGRRMQRVLLVVSLV